MKGQQASCKSEIQQGSQILKLQNDSMSYILVMLMQEVACHGLGKLYPCGFAEYSPLFWLLSWAGIECLWLFQVHCTSCQWFYHSGALQMALFSQLL